MEEARRRLRGVDKKVDLSGLLLTDSDLMRLIPDFPADAVTLDLTGNQLASLPESLGALTGLTTLDLGFNQLASLPEWLGALTGLTSLNLGDNKLASLPEWLGALTGLTTLNLTGNKLASLPEWMGALTGLTTLSLGFNQLASLPESLGALTRLTTLNLTGNKLASLPESLGALTGLTTLHLGFNQLASLPESLGALTGLTTLDLEDNELASLPESLGALTTLTTLNLAHNRLARLPESLGALTTLTTLNLTGNKLASLPEWLGALTELTTLDLTGNQLASLPEWLGSLTSLQGRRMPSPQSLGLLVGGNPLPPEILAAAAEGQEALWRLLSATAEGAVQVAEAKLLLVGPGQAGKSSLLATLCGEPWDDDRQTTHGLALRTLNTEYEDRPLTLRAWDFGGQEAFQPAHQVFFTDPAVYVVLWHPRPGVTANMVEQWIAMVAHRAPDARVLVVASRGGPKSRADDVDQDALRDRFGNLIVGFWSIDSEHDDERFDALRTAILKAADSLPNLRRSYPKRWLDVADYLAAEGRPVVGYSEYEAIAAEHGLDKQAARDLAVNSGKTGRWVYFGDVWDLSQVVVLKPEWLNVAIASVLHSQGLVDSNGLVTHSALGELWSDPATPGGPYEVAHQRMFLALMQMYELTYDVSTEHAAEPVSLIAQLVPNTRPDMSVWEDFRPADRVYEQTCRLSEGPAGPQVLPEALMFRLIVRFHLQRFRDVERPQGVHWRGGMVLQSRYGARALVTARSDVGVRVQARGVDARSFVRQVAEDVRQCVERFWEGVTVRLMVPCADVCTFEPGAGQFSVEKLIRSYDDGDITVRCPLDECNAKLSIASLLGDIGPQSETDTQRHLLEVLGRMGANLERIGSDVLDVKQGQEAVVATFADFQQQISSLLTSLTDEAANGPRLFLLEPVDPSFFKPQWTATQMRLTLVCEHSRQPVRALANDPSAGVYVFEV